ncbi:MAG TPA: hypothetical protein VIQ02_09890, partial [Jiangellaceae bacterium]
MVRGIQTQGSSAATARPVTRWSSPAGHRAGIASRKRRVRSGKGRGDGPDAQLTGLAVGCGACCGIRGLGGCHEFTAAVEEDGAGG